MRRLKIKLTNDRPHFREPTWEELTQLENEPNWDERWERFEDNVQVEGPTVYDERRGFHSKEFAELMKEHQPDEYYSWSWTPDEPE